MSDMPNDHLVSLDLKEPIWNQFYSVSPIAVVGTREGEGYNLAPKHMTMPLGWQNYFGFVCTPRHQTYRNVREEGAFTISYPRPDQAREVGLTATPREEKTREKPVLKDIPTFAATKVDGVLLEGAHLFIECQLDRIIDGLGKYSLIIGGIVAAYVHENVLRTLDRNDEDVIKQAPLFAYLHPGRYATIEESEPFPFPEGFDQDEAFPFHER